MTLSQFLNQSNRAAATQSWGMMARAMILGEAGDPMYGVEVPEAGMNWNDTTENQSETIIWFEINNNLPAGILKFEPSNIPLKELVKANLGPDTYWNWSISEWEQVLGFKFQGN